MSEEERRRGRGKAVRPAMVHVNLRVPQDVLDYYKEWPSYTKMMRTVLSNYAESQTKKS